MPTATLCSPGATRSDSCPGRRSRSSPPVLDSRLACCHARRASRGAEYIPPQTNDPIQNYNGSQCGGDMAEVFRRSCNIPFAKTAIELGVDRFVAGTEAWGIGEELPIDLPRPATSTIGDTENLDQKLPLLAIRGFGQSEDQMVPLHMAMVASDGCQRRQNDEALRRRGDVRSKLAASSAAPSLRYGRRRSRRRLLHLRPSSWSASSSRGPPAAVSPSMAASRLAAKTGTAELGIASNPDLVPRLDRRICSGSMIRSSPSPWYSPTYSPPKTYRQQVVRLAGPIAETMLNFLLTGQGAS